MHLVLSSSRCWGRPANQRLLNRLPIILDGRRAYTKLQKGSASKSKKTMPQAVVQGKPPKEEPSWARAYEKYERADVSSNAFRGSSASFRPSDALKWETRVTYPPRWQFLERRKANFTHVFHDQEKAAHHYRYVLRAFRAIYGLNSVWQLPAIRNGQHSTQVLLKTNPNTQLGGWKKGMSLDETVDRALGAPHEEDIIRMESRGMDHAERSRFMWHQFENAKAEYNFAHKRSVMLYKKDGEYKRYSEGEKWLAHHIQGCVAWHFRMRMEWLWLRFRGGQWLRKIFL